MLVKFNYPNGSNFVNHKGNMHDRNNHFTRYGDRGMTLEHEINESNQYYLSKGMAVIHKKPTPIQIVKVDYPKRSAAMIKEAYFRKASTTDYNGVYDGYYIDFDAKETKNKTSFPLSNFHQHQIDHMKACVEQGGICFALIKFTLTNEIYVLESNDLFYYWDEQFKGGKKSISKPTIDKLGYKIDYSLNPIIPYLNAVRKIILKYKEI
nr:Holliday junction resolvase RecU [Apilactobacillus ozensis]